MAKDRKFVAYRRLERPYTRKSKYRKHMYLRGNPHPKIVRFVMGNKNKTFPVSVKLVSLTDLQIRHNAFEAARMSCNRLIEKHLGKSGFYFRIHTYPHHALRENALASGAGADRLSTGMKKSFGKTIGMAARVMKGTVVAEIGVDKKDVALAKKAMKYFMCKLPNSYRIIVEESPSGSTVPTKTQYVL